MPTYEWGTMKIYDKNDYNISDLLTLKNNYNTLQFLKVIEY